MTYPESSLHTPDARDNASLAASEPNNFQHIASEIWSPPHAMALGLGSESPISDQKSGAGRIPEIDGVQTHLAGLTHNPKTELTVDAKVVVVEPDVCNQQTGLAHEHALLEDASGEYFWWAHDLNYADRVPIKVGDNLELKGEWINTNEVHDGQNTIGVIHWTHDGEIDADHPNRHQSGYVELNGVKYHNRQDGPLDSCSV